MQSTVCICSFVQHSYHEEFALQFLNAQLKAEGRLAMARHHANEIAHGQSHADLIAAKQEIEACQKQVCSSRIWMPACAPYTLILSENLQTACPGLSSQLTTLPILRIMCKHQCCPASSASAELGVPTLFQLRVALAITDGASRWKPSSRPWRLGVRLARPKLWPLRQWISLRYLSWGGSQSSQQSGRPTQRRAAILPQPQAHQLSQ